MPCPPAPPKAPPRCHSRGVSWARRYNLEDEPQAQWSARSGRYAAVCVGAAPPTRDLSAQPPDRMPTVALARAMVRHCFRGLRAGYELLKGTHTKSITCRVIEAITWDHHVTRYVRHVTGT